MPYNKSFILTRLLFHCLLASPVLAVAADEPTATPMTTPVVGQPTMDLRLGAFVLSNIDTSLTLTKSGGPGSTLDFSEGLGGESSLSVFRADASWNISGRHGLDASWYDIARSGHVTLATSFVYGGTTYNVGADVNSRFATNFYKVAYSYAFYKKERHEVTGLIGLHIMNIDNSISVVGTGNISGAGTVEKFSVTAPLPTFGLAWKATWTDRLTTRMSLQYFGISLDEGTYSGHLTDFLAAAEYRLTARSGLGLGYNRFDLEANFKEGPLNLKLDYNFNGLLAYCFVRF
jgi:hypothetical protein